VRTEHGKGRFLCALTALSVERPITRFESTSDMLFSLGYKAETLVLSVSAGRCDRTEQQALGLADDEEVIRVERLRTAQDDPLVYSVEAIPRDRLAGSFQHLKWTGSLTDILAANGHQPISSAARLEASELPKSVESDYSLAGYGPWLLITETAITAAAAPIHFSKLYHRGNRFAFNVLRQ
jgi:GntR family transcriptional regulator